MPAIDADPESVYVACAICSVPIPTEEPDFGGWFAAGAEWLCPECLEQLFGQCSAPWAVIARTKDDGIHVLYLGPSRTIGEAIDEWASKDKAFEFVRMTRLGKRP